MKQAFTHAMLAIALLAAPFTAAADGYFPDGYYYPDEPIPQTNRYYEQPYRPNPYYGGYGRGYGGRLDPGLQKELRFDSCLQNRSEAECRNNEMMDQLGQNVDQMIRMKQREYRPGKRHGHNDRHNRNGGGYPYFLPY